MDDPDVALSVEIPRPPAEVRAWWLDIADDYRATDRREQPHRIRVVARRADGMDLQTWWRAPWGELLVPETFHFRPDGWDVDVHLPFGLAQRDHFVLSPTPAGTRVEIKLKIRPRNLAGRFARPAFLRYARKSYPRTWRAAAKICARDAPRLTG